MIAAGRAPPSARWGRKAVFARLNGRESVGTTVTADFNLDELRLAVLGRRDVVPASIGLVSFIAALVFLKIYIEPISVPRLFAWWWGLTAGLMALIVGVVIVFSLRRPGDRETVRVWLPVSRIVRTAMNVSMIVSPWVLLPDAEPALRGILMMMYLWFLATEVMATVDPGSLLWLGLAGMPASLAIYLFGHHARYAVALSLFYALAAASLFMMHRVMRLAALRNLDLIAIPSPPPLPEAPPQQFKLTRRQTEVLRHLSEGRSNKEIARALGVAPATVKTHVEQTLLAMEASNRTEAAVKGRMLGVV
jgi:DNA-binding CsgD family transcriptional regulator